jgi:hypothetical protein
MAARVGPYEVVKHLASGEIFEEYLGRVEEVGGFHRVAVIRQLRSELARDPRLVRRFLVEARLIASLHHRSLVQIHDVGEDAGGCYLAMERVHGEDLRSVLAAASRTRQHVPLGHALAIISAAAAGLQHAHARRGSGGQSLGVVHQHLSPSSIRIGYDGQVKVDVAPIASNGQLVAGSAYRSPEQCRGGHIDARTDVHALGVILYELATTTRLFKGDRDRIAEAIVQGRVPSPRSKRPDLPEELAAIILRALATDPERRHGSADELGGALDQLSRKLGLASSSAALAAYLRRHFGEPRDPWLAEPEALARSGSGGHHPSEGAAVVRQTGRSIAAESGPTAPPSRSAATGDWRRAAGAPSTVARLALGALGLGLLTAAAWRLASPARERGAGSAVSASVETTAAPAAVVPQGPGASPTARQATPAPTITEHMPAFTVDRVGGTTSGEDPREHGRTRGGERGKRSGSAKPEAASVPPPSASAPLSPASPGSAARTAALAPEEDVASAPGAPGLAPMSVTAPPPTITAGPAATSAPAAATAIANVAPTTLDANRVAGDPTIVPDETTQIEIKQRGFDRVLGTYKVCLNASGEPTLVTLLKSTGFVAYDQKITRTIRSQWRYRPYLVDGRPSPVCTAVRFIYTQG